MSKIVLDYQLKTKRSHERKQCTTEKDKDKQEMKFN